MTNPKTIIWDITYACPLRCAHCYSESGRRPSRQLGHDDMVRVTDALISMRPNAIVLGGGEPLVVPGVFEITERISRAGIRAVVYTSGWPFQPTTAMALARTCTRVNVSVDGATAEVHDRIRGRAGSFHRAMSALAQLNEVAWERRMNGEEPLRFGIDATIVRSSFGQLDEFCTDIAPRFPELGFIWFAAALPSGLASRESFADQELLTDAEINRLVSVEQLTRLRSRTPKSVRVDVTENPLLPYHPAAVAQGRTSPPMQVEPDGEVRGILIYEGTVGNVLTEPPAVLWERAMARWRDPVVIEAMSTVRTMKDWAAAARRIDHHFGSDADRARIERRPAYLRQS
jgi:hypothetical protein